MAVTPRPRDFDTIASKMPGPLGRRVRAAAAKAKVSPSRWMADAARERLGDEPTAETPEGGRRAPRGGSADASEAEPPPPCEHPRAKRRVHSWGTTCGECGGPVR